MISRVLYEHLRNDAIDNLVRIRTFCSPQNEIVFVVSPDVYMAIRSFDRSELTQSEDPVSMTYKCRLHGAMICVASNPIHENLFFPAISGMLFYPQMANGDLILLDGRIYRLDNTTGPQFVDSGMTVEEEFCPDLFWRNQILAEPYEINYEMLSEAIANRGKRKVKKTAEKDFDVGDTKALDDFLESFRQQGVLQQT